MSEDTRAGTTHRFSLPRRSRGDRKLAGVAGGLGRAFGVDPVLLRVAFVVLAIFGGSGVLLYCLGWLLMPADGDEVSAIEALAGRGRSSVSTALTIVLIIVGLSSAGSVFSWGLPFWPVVIAAVVVFALVRHGRMGSGGRSGGRFASSTGAEQGWGRPEDGHDWGRRADEFAERAAAWGARAGARASEWADRWSGNTRTGGDGQRGPASPFGRPAFWERPGAPSDTTGPTTAGGVNAAWAPPDPATTTAAPQAPSPQAQRASSQQAPSPEELLTRGRGAPPAWDPLGAAPFAWDLPDPTPLAEPESAAPARRRGLLPRLFVGLALAIGGVLAGGVFAGWWALSWAAVAAIALAVLGFGLLVTSLRGSGGRALIGPGIFLSLVTLALTVTGITGTTAYGQHTWTPTTVAAVDGQSFHWNAGQATLDLSGLQIAQGRTVTTDLIVNGGQATVLVPKGVHVEALCSARVGDVSCLGAQQSGFRPEASGRQTGDGAHGTLKIEVRTNAGQVEVRSNG